MDHRRKKLHGAGCAKVKTVLKEVLCVPLEALVETSDPTAVLCYSCERTPNNIDTLVAKAETLKEDVRKKVSALQSVTASGGKRQRPTSDTELPQAKQIAVITDHLHLHLPVSLKVAFQLQLKWLSRSFHQQVLQ